MWSLEFMLSCGYIEIVVYFCSKSHKNRRFWADCSKFLSNKQELRTCPNPFFIGGASQNRTGDTRILSPKSDSVRNFNVYNINLLFINKLTPPNHHKSTPFNTNYQPEFILKLSRIGHVNQQPPSIWKEIRSKGNRSFNLLNKPLAVGRYQRINHILPTLRP